MRLNRNMRSLLEEHAFRPLDYLSENNIYPVWRKTDVAGRSYWGVSAFWGLDKHSILSDIDLSQLEWDGNEVHLNARSDKEISNMLRQAIGIINFWRNELESKYPETPFYIFATYDNGEMLVLDEGELPAKSVTMRFWADRGNNTVINFEQFESWDQPAIIEYCNFVSAAFEQNQ